MVFFKKHSGQIFCGAFILVFAWVNAQLFFEKQTNAILTSVAHLISGSNVIEEQIKVLRVVYPDSFQSLDPTIIDPTVRQRINNIYESLIRPDGDLKMSPSLAVSWGMTDERTWDFRLRPDVIFHDGSAFSAEDVLASLNRSRNIENSQMVTLLENIDKIEIVDDLRIIVKTLKPDPLLLQRLSLLLISPAEFEKSSLPNPIGTGSYMFLDQSADGAVNLERFKDYWGRQSKFEMVKLISEQDKNERTRKLLEGEADFLTFVPYDAVKTVKERGFDLTGMPSLEVQFLLFNFRSNYLNNADKRKAVSLVIDQDYLVKNLGAFALPVNQFVSNGIFGFNPEITKHEFNEEEAKELAKKSGIKGTSLTLHLPYGYNLIGEHLRTQLKKIGVNMLVSYLMPGDLVKSLAEKKADIYFLGFRSDIGDSSDFLGQMIRSKADFNIASYSNREMDKLIDYSFVQLDPAIRATDLQKAMRILIEDEVLGVPLFEYENIYGFSPKLRFRPRIDGYLYFDELNIK